MHAGATDTIVVDQTAASGWVSLGEFDFVGSGEEYVMLGDNTGEAGTTNTQLLFDAVRVLPLDGGPTDMPGGGCCDSSGRSGATGGLGVLFCAGVLSRRSRRRRARA